ncbi:MAG: hypothetical protein FJZ87_02720 [Chloroflexi bacterium]|nr:hypothetical protein [Chloroflexota bacterium]
MFRKRIIFLLLPIILFACSPASVPMTEKSPAAAVEPVETQPAETQSAPITSEAGTSSTNEAFGIYMSLSKDGNNLCTFGEVTHCRLFFAEVTSTDDALGIVEGSFKEILPDVPAVMPSVSPDGTLLAFTPSNSKLHGKKIISSKSSPLVFRCDCPNRPGLIKSGRICY